MNPALMTIILFCAFLLLLALGLPISFCLIGLGVLFMAVFMGTDKLYAIYSSVFRVTTTDIYIALPLFVVMASVLQFSGVGESLFDMMHKWFGGIRGGLAMGVVFICTIIAATTGLGATGIVTIGVLAYPEMLKRGYNRYLAIGCIPTASSLGPLIPPSTLMIIIGGFAQISIGALFMGGVFTGLLMSALFMATIVIRCLINPTLAPSVTREQRATWPEKMRSLSKVVLPTILIVLVLGSIYAGVATPSEAGGVGALGALVCAAIYRKLNWKNLKQALYSSLRTTVMIMWLLLGGITFSSLLTTSGISSYLKDALLGLQVSTLGYLIIMMIVPLILGMFIDGVAISMICLPIFMPLINTLGIDPVWFGILFTINLIIGYITPPFGVNLFYTVGAIPGISTSDVYKAVAQFLPAMLLTLILTIIFPALATWLPSMMIQKPG